MKIRLFITLTILLAASLTPSASAALLAFQNGATLGQNSLTGNVTYQGWDQLVNAIPAAGATRPIDNRPLSGADNNTRPYGWHNLTGAWNQTLASNLGTGTASLWKSGGYGYIAGSSLHQGAQTNAILPGGNFVVTTNAINGLKTFLFQIEATDRSGQIFGAAPTLSFGATTIGATHSALYEVTPNFIQGQNPQDKHFYAFQWDLTGHTIAQGTAMTVNWTGLTNSGIYGLQINQGDTYVQVVPEPGVAGLFGLGIVGMLWSSRSRRGAGALQA